MKKLVIKNKGFEEKLMVLPYLKAKETLIDVSDEYTRCDFTLNIKQLDKLIKYLSNVSKEMKETK